MTERLDSTKVKEKISEFFESDSSGVIKTILKGPNEPEPVACSAIYCVYPTRDERREVLVIAGDKTETFYNEALLLETPEQDSEDNSVEKYLQEKYSIENELPTIVLAFGKGHDSQKEFAILANISALSPRSALESVKKWIKRRDVIYEVI